MALLLALSFFMKKTLKNNDDAINEVQEVDDLLSIQQEEDTMTAVYESLSNAKVSIYSTKQKPATDTELVSRSRFVENPCGNIDYDAPTPYESESSGSEEHETSVSKSVAPNPARSSGFFAKMIPLSELFLPAQEYHLGDDSTDGYLNQTNITTYLGKKYLNIRLGSIKTHDNACLNTIEITPKKVDERAIETRLFIIHFNGNGSIHERNHIDYMKLARKLQATVIGFNYRGVVTSTKNPSSFQDLITDGIAQVQRLLDKGANSEHILLHGHSLGGGVATMVAYHFHQLKKPIYVWNSRSFSSLSAAASGMITSNKLYSFVNYGISATCENILRGSGWDMDIASAYNAIPTQYKSYMVVAKLSAKSRGDGVIAHEASLHKAVRCVEKPQGINTGHKMFARSAGHNLPGSHLVSKTNPLQNGDDLFVSFFERMGKK